MSVRVATYRDTAQVLEFLEEYHRDRSNLSDVPFHKPSMALAVDYYIAQPNHVCFTNVEEGAVTGVLMASIEPFMFNAKRKWATDLVFVATKGGAWLLKRFISWAESHQVDRIFMGVSTGDTSVDALYKVMGLQPLGGMYGMSPKAVSSSLNEKQL